MPVALILGLMDLLKIAVPAIQKEVNAGNVTIEQQKQVLDAYNDLRANLDQHFEGPEWDIEPDEIPPSPI